MKAGTLHVLNRIGIRMCFRHSGVGGGGGGGGGREGGKEDRER